MKKKIIFIILFCLMFVGKAKAYTIDEFFDLVYNDCIVSTSNPLQRDCYNSNGKLISYVLGLEHRTISYELDTKNIKDAVSSSYILRYLVTYAPTELLTEYKKVSSPDIKVDFDKYNCQMDKSGYCFEDNGDNSTMTVKIDTTFIRFLISEYKGVPIEMIEYVENEDPFFTEREIDDEESEDNYSSSDDEEYKDEYDEDDKEDVEETLSEIKEEVYKKDDSANIIIIVLISIIFMLVVVIILLVLNLNKNKKDNAKSIEG